MTEKDRDKRIRQKKTDRAGEERRKKNQEK
jgi:hypothetical protein